MWMDEWTNSLSLEIIASIRKKEQPAGFLRCREMEWMIGQQMVAVMEAVAVLAVMVVMTVEAVVTEMTLVEVAIHKTANRVENR